MIDPEQIRARPWVIIGGGYTGERLARRLIAHGATAWVTRRSAEDAATTAAALGARGHAVDLDRPDTLRGWMPHGGVIVDTAPPVASSPAAERALVAAAAEAGAARIVYVSSTGVYPPGDGRWIDEDEPVAPASRQGQARLEAEAAILDQARHAAIPAVSLRAVGIYGPGRGVPARLLAGTYRVVGAGATYVCRIHVDDLVSTIIAAALAPSLPRAIYNVSDDAPETSRALADAIADALGVPRPPSVPESEVEPWVRAMLTANRRVSNARIKAELGVTLAYPTWREGLAQIMSERDAAR